MWETVLQTPFSVDFTEEQARTETEELFQKDEAGKNTKYLEPTDSGVISALDVDQAKELLELSSDVLDFAQMDYLMNAIRACEAGANRVHLLSGEFQGSVLQEVFSARGDGTMVYANQYSSIRPANIEDIPDILRVMQDYIAKD